jgi:predicted peptidase
VGFDSAGCYRVVITNSCGLTNSAAAVLTIQRSWQSGLDLHYTEGATTMPYRLYLPKDYSPAISYPLVLFLHGVGECGTGNGVQVQRHIAGLIERIYSDYPAFLVAPQLSGGSWTPYNPSDLTLGILAQVRRNYAVDERRIYFTGLSLGGFGTTDYAYDYPTLFAAIAPMSGAEEFFPNDVTEFQLSRLPTWLFHGSADGTDSVNYSRDYYLLVTGQPTIIFSQTNYGYPTTVSGPIRYTEFTGKGHDIWELIYAGAGTDFYDWMFAQTRPPATITCDFAFAAGDTLFVRACSDVPFASAFLLVSTNLLAPLSQWQCLATNWFDANGRVIFTRNADHIENQRYFMLRSP